MKTEAIDEYSRENLAIAGDIEVMMRKAAALYEMMRFDIESSHTILHDSSRQRISLELRTLNRQMLRGLEELKQRLEGDLYMVERWAETYHCLERSVTLANALGKSKRGIKSSFYIQSAFNQ